VVAEQVESELLAVFDYAWNKGSNGNRRSRDILAKLFMAWPSNDSFCNPRVFSSKKWLFCGTNAVGIKVALRRPQDPDSSKNLCYLLTAPPPQQLPVSVRAPVKVASLELRCGVMTEKGVPCNAPPVRGRKRCLQHKGMRVRGVPAAGNPPLLATHAPTTGYVTKGSSSMKQESVKVGGASWCLPKVFPGRQSLFSTKTRTDHSKAEYKTEYKTDHCKEEPKTELKELEAGERRRPLSLSFNTWMNERVHGSLDSGWMGPTENELEISLHKAMKQEQGHAAGMSASVPKRRVRQISSKYMSVPGDDSKRR
jgi:hypothetical protein